MLCPQLALLLSCNCAGIGSNIVPAFIKGFVDNFDEEHILIETSACNVFIDSKSYSYLKGSLIDYVDEGLNQGIKFINPNAKAVCGCGESFTI